METQRKLSPPVSGPLWATGSEDLGWQFSRFKSARKKNLRWILKDLEVGLGGSDLDPHLRIFIRL